MSLNQTTFSSLSSSQLVNAFSFLGSSTTGFGQLSAGLAHFSDPLTGAIKAQQDQFDVTYKTLNDRVNTLSDRATQMQTSLSAKLQAADAQIARMQSQQQLLTATIQGLSFASFGFQSNNTSTSSFGG
jgi:flagellar capping protein FliD